MLRTEAFFYYVTYLAFSSLLTGLAKSQNCAFQCSVDDGSKIPFQLGPLCDWRLSDHYMTPEAQEAFRNSEFAKLCYTSCQDLPLNQDCNTLYNVDGGNDSFNLNFQDCCLQEEPFECRFCPEGSGGLVDPDSLVSIQSSSAQTNGWMATCAEFEAYYNIEFLRDQTDSPTRTCEEFKRFYAPFLPSELPDCRCSNTPIGDWNIQDAVDLWINDQATAEAVYGRINDWDTSNVQYGFNGLFEDKPTFNNNISLWDVSSSRSMAGMFRSAQAFNGDISGWDVSTVGIFRDMFYGASSFNQNIGGWNVSRGRFFSSMFAYASSFNQDLSAWDVDQAWDFSSMFLYAESFEQTLCWDLSGKRYTSSEGPNVYGAFCGSPGGFDAACVPESTLEYMYTSTICVDDLTPTTLPTLSPTKSLQTTIEPITDENIKLAVNLWVGDQAAATVTYGDISDWDTSRVTTGFEGLFDGQTSFNDDVSRWDVSSATTMASMFKNAAAFNVDISKWNTSNVELMFYMFNQAKAFNQDISRWDVSRVRNFFRMFAGASSFNRDLSAWNITDKANLNEMFYQAESFDQSLCWNIDAYTVETFCGSSGGIDPKCGAPDYVIRQSQCWSALVKYPEGACELSKSDYSAPGWYYLAALGVIMAIFLPTVFLQFKVSEKSRKKNSFALLVKFAADLNMGLFLFVSIYKLVTTDGRCDPYDLRINVIVSSLVLGVDQIGELLAAIALQNGHGLKGDFEDIKWQGMERLGGWTIALFSAATVGITVSIGAVFGLGSDIFDEEGATKNIRLAAAVLMFLCIPVVLVVLPLYGHYYEDTFTWENYCAGPCNVSWVCNRNSWKNEDGVHPRYGPVWGGGDRVIVESTHKLLSWAEMVLNIESGLATLFPLVLYVALGLVRLVKFMFCPVRDPYDDVLRGTDVLNDTDDL